MAGGVSPNEVEPLPLRGVGIDGEQLALKVPVDPQGRGRIMGHPDKGKGVELPLSPTPVHPYGVHPKVLCTKPAREGDEQGRNQERDTAHQSSPSVICLPGS